MFPTVFFFESPQNLPGIFDFIFGGLFLIKGLPIFCQMGFLVSLFLSCTAAYHHQQKPKYFWYLWGVSSTFLGLLLGALLLFQPWDELFISFRHSHHLATDGIFSFNRLEKIEGIVDFLPFFLLGLLSKFGFPLIETNFFMVVIGSWLCILAGRKILVHLGCSENNLWLFPILLLFPPLLLNTGNGFSVTLFTAAILWSVLLLNFAPPGWAGFLLLSLVPLIRLEGIWFCILEFLFLFKSQQGHKSARPLWGLALLCFIPVLLLSIWRYFTFGSFIPVPITYKSSLGSLFFILMGTRNLGMDLLASGAFVTAGFLLNLWFISKKDRLSPPQRVGLTINLLLFGFCIPYYLSGGDWFPAAWGRYLFPFSFFSYVTTVGFVLGTPLKPHWNFSHFPLWIALLFTLLLPFGSPHRLLENLFTHKTSLAGLNQNKKVGKPNVRIQQLSQLGYHLEHTTDPQAVIASSEVASIMFFAHREALDFLGVANPQIAAAPLRPTPTLFGRVKDYNELPHLIFKRLKPELLAEKKPEIFYAFDFMITELLGTPFHYPIGKSDLEKAFSIWNQRFSRMNEALFGGVETLKRLGYVPVLIKYGETYYSLYFVSPTLREKHFSMLKRNGMSLSEIKSNHL